MTDRTLVMGDVHGALKAVEQVLQRANYDPPNDKLIFLGDVADGWPDTAQCVDFFLNQTGKFVFIEGNHDCLDPKTEALTENGWKNYDEIEEGEKVYTFNRHKELGEWQPVQKVIIKEHQDSLVASSGHKTDFKVTPTHRLMRSKRRRKEGNYYFGKYEYERAGDVRGRIKLRTAANTDVRGVSITINMIQLVAWLLSDGGRVNGYYRIYQSKQEYIEEI